MPHSHVRNEYAKPRAVVPWVGHLWSTSRHHLHRKCSSDQPAICHGPAADSAAATWHPEVLVAVVWSFGSLTSWRDWRVAGSDQTPAEFHPKHRLQLADLVATRSDQVELETRVCLVYLQHLPALAWSGQARFVWTLWEVPTHRPSTSPC